MITFFEDEALATSEPLSVWAEPEHDAVYVIGADVAEGLDHGDYSCAHVLDARTGAQMACWHGRTPADVFGEELRLLGLWYNTALIGVEQNNHGLTTITRLRQLEYPNLYRHKTVDQVSKKQTLKFGWPTNATTKPLMIDDLDRAMREGSISIYDRLTVGELKTYVRDERAKMHGSPHDDRVMSLAIAVQMLPFALTYVPGQAEMVPRWSGEWWKRQIAQVESEKPVDGVVAIGAHNRRRR